VVRHKSANVVTFNKNKLESARGEFDYPESNISPFSTYNRLTVFANYIGWLEKELFPSKESTTELELKTIRGDKFGKNSEIVDWGNDRALEDHQVMRLLDVVHPDSKENPWKSEAVRWRNYLIVNLMFAVGCRRGELLKIRVGTDNYPPDIKKREKNGRYFVLLRANRDDGKGGAKPDQRKYRPEGKTKTRLVPLDKRMVEIYENYLIHHRPKATGSEHIEYLFITHGDTTQCRALSISAMQKIFTEISKVLKFKVQTHTGRHTWNEKFSKYADGRIADGKTTEAKSEADRRKLMGWSEDSSMARLYAKRHDNERAWNMGVELQEEDSTTINSIVQKRDEDLWTDGE
ncbi:tyrosine-type recombinase/integrase, partial [Vibrio breoganii]